MKILLEISYVGTGFAGYQVQPGKLTVQSALQDAIEKVYGERYAVKGCSRTDTGVHALQYFATFDTDKSIPTDRIPHALNSVLDKRISVRSAQTVDMDFHVRHDVLYKEYEYRVQLGAVPNPFLDGRVWHYPKLLRSNALERMQNAAKAFVGTHDFSGFMSAGSDVADTVRDVKWLKVSLDDDMLTVRIAADGFLYNMVRIIVGTLIEAGSGRIDPEKMVDIIASCDRSSAGMTAPPEGLYLKEIVFAKQLQNN